MEQLATTTAEVVPFPKRNKGRVRKSEGWDAMGMTSMYRTGTAGDNIELLDCGDRQPVDAVDMAFYLCQIILNTTPGLLETVRDQSFKDAALGSQRTKTVAMATARLLCAGRA